jgi:hypothetical protein
MNYTKRRLNKILQSTSKQTRKKYKTNKKHLFSNSATIRNRKQFNLRSNTLKNI